MFNCTANVNAQQVNNTRGKGSDSLIGNMSCATRVINITDVIIPVQVPARVYRKFLLLRVVKHPNAARIIKSRLEIIQKTHARSVERTKAASMPPLAPLIRITTLRVLRIAFHYLTHYFPPPSAPSVVGISVANGAWRAR
jgi:hypothetical protein